MDSASSPPSSPHEEVENDNRQPPIVGSPSQVIVPAPLLSVHDVEHNHEQFINSNSPNLLPSPENSVGRQQPSPLENDEDQQETPDPPSSPPEVKIIDGEQPLAPLSPSTFLPRSPPSTVDEIQPEKPNPSPNREFLVTKQSPSPAPLPPPIEAEYPPENPSAYVSPLEHLSHNHESPLSQQPSSPPPIEPEYPTENLLPNDPSPPEILSHNHESSPEIQPPSPSLSQLSPPTEAVYSPENLSPNHESPLLKPTPSPSSSRSPLPSPSRSPLPSPSRSPLPSSSASAPPTGAEDPVESPNYAINPTPNSNSNSNSDHRSPSSPAELQGNPNPSPKSIQSPKDLSPSPPLATVSPSSAHQHTPEPNTLTPPLGVPLLLHAATTFSPNKPQISPWTHQETANLIQAYQEKWYSLKKGPLKAGQWEEVAITVAARCGYDEPTKTSKQCRHKIEKLRKRYRSERGKPRSKAAAWNFFKLMDNLEKGPLPISSSQPMELVEYQKPSNSNGKKRKNNVYDDDRDREFLANKRSNHDVANGSLARNLRFSEGGNRVVRGLRTPVVHRRKGFYQEQEENNENGGEEDDLATQLAAEIKGFAEKFVKMENKKIEMMRDVERYRSEMENKKMEMILESQQMLVETVNNAFGSSVKTHKLSAS